MPSKSKAQQRFMGMVVAAKEGKLKNPSKAVKDAAESISLSDAKDFARQVVPNAPKVKRPAQPQKPEVLRVTSLADLLGLTKRGKKINKA